MANAESDEIDADEMTIVWPGGAPVTLRPHLSGGWLLDGHLLQVELGELAACYLNALQRAGGSAGRDELAAALIGWAGRNGASDPPAGRLH